MKYVFMLSNIFPQSFKTFYSAPLIVIMLLAGYAKPAASAQELSFLNWADYMDPEILLEFKQRTGITVKQTYFDSDTGRDSLLLETDGKGFDLTIVNGSQVRILARRGWLDPINDAEIPNLKYIKPRWRNEHLKAKEYGVPYFWGTLGIAYRQDLVSGEVNSWMDLFRPQESVKGRIGMIRDSRDMIGAALKALGYSMDSEDREALKQAEKLLEEQAPHVKTYDYIGLHDESALVTGQVVMSMMYSGDALMVQEHDSNITYVVPEEGGNIWVDYLCVLSGSSNKKEARQFIDFLNEPDIAARLAEYVYYATPNMGAEKLLPEEFTSDPVIYPSESVLSRSESYKPINARIAKRRAAIFSRIVD